MPFSEEEPRPDTEVPAEGAAAIEISNRQRERARRGFNRRRAGQHLGFYTSKYRKW